ncbi:hypothetical protein GQ54DRAFT_32903 [Martensiomyces pterosporus]|nr:hypothetical protein GQ54DRAFT_32903 [Martensiomyces pterosporus]
MRFFAPRPFPPSSLSFSAICNFLNYASWMDIDLLGDGLPATSAAPATTNAGTASSTYRDLLMLDDDDTTQLPPSVMQPVQPAEPTLSTSLSLLDINDSDSANEGGGLADVRSDDGRDGGDDEEFGDFLQSDEIDPWRQSLQPPPRSAAVAAEEKADVVNDDFGEFAESTASYPPSSARESTPSDFPMLQPDEAHDVIIPSPLPPPPSGSKPGTVAGAILGNTQEAHTLSRRPTLDSRKSSISAREDPLELASDQVLSWMSAADTRGQSAGALAERINSTWESAAGLFGGNQSDHIAEIARRIGAVIPEGRGDLAGDRAADLVVSKTDIDGILAESLLCVADKRQSADVGSRLRGVIWPRDTQSEVERDVSIDGDLVHAYLRLAEMSKALE